MKARLHPATASLVNRFAAALAAKLLAVQQKRGLMDQWATDDWEAECRAQLATHLRKGDPIDVGAYVAFMWSRGWSTSEPHDFRGYVPALLDIVTETSACLRALYATAAVLGEEAIRHDVMWLANSILIITEAAQVLGRERDPQLVAAGCEFAAESLGRLVEATDDPRQTAHRTFARWPTTRTGEALALLRKLGELARGEEGALQPANTPGSAPAALHIVADEARPGRPG